MHRIHEKFILFSREVPVRDTWERFYAKIGTCDLYRDEEMLQSLLDDLAKLPIKHVETMEGGTRRCYIRAKSFT